MYVVHFIIYAIFCVIFHNLAKKIKTEGRGCKLAKYCFEKEKKILITNNEVQKDVTQYYSCAEKKKELSTQNSLSMKGSIWE